MLYIFVSVSMNPQQSDSTFSGRANELQTLTEVPVEINIEEQYVVSGVPEYVSVSFEGPTGILTPTLVQGNFDIYADLTGLGPGQHTVELQVANISPELGVYIEPRTVDVTIEERATEEFPVNVDFLNADQLAPGRELIGSQVEPETVTISTSQSIIDQVGVVKVFIDLTGEESSINNREAQVNIYDHQGNQLDVASDPEDVGVSVQIESPNKNVPVEVQTTGQLPEGYTLNGISANTEEVEVRAITEVLESVNAVSTEPIDLSQITETTTLDVPLDLPSDVYVPSTETIEVTVEVSSDGENVENNNTNEVSVEQDNASEEAQAAVAEDTEAAESTETASTEEVETAEGEQTQVIEDVPIQTTGSTQDSEVTFIEPQNQALDLQLTGNGEAMSDWGADDFTVTVNTDGLTPGEHAVPITVEGPDLEGATVHPEHELATIEIS